MTSRAQAGGGRAIALNPGSWGQPYSIGMTYGANGQGSDWFGPGQPMAPQAPAEVAGRAFDFPNGVNIVTSTRPYSPITYETLRAFADGYDLLRLIIETRKDAMERLRWVIKPRDSTEKLTPQKKNKIKALTQFFLKPDGEHHWNAWLRMLLEDLFVIDAPTLHRRRTVGGRLLSLDQIDGATIRRVLNDWGRTPENDDETAYQQILKGMPAVNYRKSDILFRPRNIRIHKIYGYSPVEQLLMTINIALRRQIFQLNFFTEGNIPPALIGVPETWTPDQIRTFQEWFDNILAGNLAERRRARFVPSAVGKTYVPTQETELFGKAEEWLARVACFAFGLSPQPFLQMMNRATADSAAQEAAQTGMAPIQNWVKDLIDSILAEDLDAADFEFLWRGDDELDPLKRQQITTAYVNGGLLPVNEARADMGREPYEDPIFDQPMFMTSNGLAPLALTDQSQGGAKLDANGNPVGEADPAGPSYQGDEDDGVVKTLAELVAEGDPDKLAKYLKSLTEEHTHE